ncbi:hypothetical protein [Prosthecodimorpha staleyi]|uniref:Uncharacterized protein n=1 Tax=Prosthecodimorpha staleyi TaxID=2840188 RepID=A0A947D7V4_9HYPH|nr:hypothetical protein [Prosthecodimorpha staleyi]MBT9291714.1 hypothetical protein [Prosthecodimorpha staleyi]
MQDIFCGRMFQFWEYTVSHGSLLIRSPATSETDKTLDIVAYAVEYVSIPRHFGDISIARATQSEVVDVARLVDRTLHETCKVWTIESSGSRFLIAATFLQFREYNGSIFDSPFRDLWDNYDANSRLILHFQ